MRVFADFASVTVECAKECGEPFSLSDLAVCGLDLAEVRTEYLRRFVGQREGHLCVVQGYQTLTICEVPQKVR